MGRKDKNKKKSPAPAVPIEQPINERDLILEKNEEKLMEQLRKKYPEVKERISLKQSKKKSKSKSGSEIDSNSPTSSMERKKSSERSLSNDQRKYRPLTKKEKKNLEFNWKPVDTLNSIPPDDYTITHVNQDLDLLVKKLFFLIKFNFF